MKDTVLLLLCAVALAQATHHDPEQRSCNCDPSEAQQLCYLNYGNDEILIAHENCDQFYKCANGKPVAFYCPNNLLYDPYAQTCDWPHNVECGNRPISEGPSQGADNDSGSDDDSDIDNDLTCNCNPDEAPSICAAEGSNGIFVAHQNCNQFYQCAEGRPVSFSCSPTLLYNPYKRACDWPQNVECGDRVIPEPEEDNDSTTKEIENDGTCNCNPEEAPAICAAPNSESVLISHENCNMYYICNHGVPVATSCSGNLLFNPYTKQCDWPSNIDCGDRLVPEIECTGCNENTNDDTSCDDDDVSPKDDEAPPASDGDAVTKSPPGTCNCNPEEASSICAADDTNTVLVAHENCNQFYKCDHGKPVVLTCQEDLVYNPYTEQCDWPENVDCGDRVIPDPDDSYTTPEGTNPPDTIPGNNCDPSEAPALCAADNSDGVLVAHENCNQFYKCSGGKPEALKCPPNLLFNPAKDQCDWPENVDCGDRVIPDPDSGSSEVSPPGVVVPTQPPGTCNCNPEEAPSICAADDSSGILIAHENCNQFYTCDHGKPVVRTCHGDLLYNPYTEQCDWPENVNCGDRVIPDPDNTSTTPRGTNPDVTNQPDTTPGNNCDPSEAPALCAADNSDGVLVAHENCNQFYKCSGGKPEALKCPPNLLFNPAKDQCDWPENVDCGDRVIPDPEASDSESSDIQPPGDDVVVPTRPPGTCNCNPGEAPAICAADDSSGVLIAHENCNQFYTCDHGKPVVRTCHGDLLYNPYTEQCDWPENVNCGDRVIPDPDSISTTPRVTNPDVTNQPDTTPGNNCDPSEAPALCAADNSDGVLVAHENCNQFYKCSGGKPEALKCPPNLLFNPAKDQCDWPENVDCGDRVIPDPEASDSGSSEVTPPGVVVPTRPPGTCNCNPEEAPSICAADDSSGILIAHENCNQFYTCDHGKPVVRTCHGDLLYNPYTEQCDWPENVNCGDRVIPDPDSISTTPRVTNPDVTNQPDTTPGNNCDPSEAPALCAADNSDGVLVAHENCNQFYKCSGGKPEALKCPPNLLFNPAKDQCDWPENVDCGDRVIPDPEASGSGSSEVTPPGVVVPTRPPGTCNCNPEEAPSICAADDSSGVLIAHENCNQFYACDHGIPIVRTCPGDLLYNPYTEQCDWPENVDCGDRVIPDPEASDSESSDIQPPGDDVVVPTRPPGTCNCNPGEAPAICAADNSSGILIAHENCNQFYTCDHGKPVVRTCHGDLLYNPYTEQCDWPENVNCGDRVIPDPDSISTTPRVTNPDVTNQPDTTPGNNCDPSEAPALCAADNSDGVLVAHENCNQFYKCSGGKPEALKCPPNLLFNPAKDQCDWPENVDCGDRVIPDPEASDSGSSEVTPPGVVVPTRPPGTCNCNPEEAPSICAADDSSGILIAHENCNQFYTCDHGKPVVRTCHGDLLYNPYTEQCDWPENVNCGDRVIPDPDSISTTPRVTNPDVTNQPDTTPGNNCDPSEAPALCAADNSDGVLVAHENCNQFYKCSGGKPEALKCPPNLLFNPAKDQCDWPENVDCGDRVIPDPEASDSGSSEVTPPGVVVPTRPPGTCNCNPEEAPSICAADDSSGVLIAHENCNQFYACDHGKPIVRTCPGDLLYNPYTEQCDWPENVDCGDRVIPDPEASDSESSDIQPPGDDVVVPTRPPGTCNCNPGEAPAICAADNSSGILIAHENCNQFYTCDHGKPVVRICHGDLLYNPYTEQCDWPENVDCGDRVIPDPEASDSGSSEVGPPGVVVPTRPPGTCNCNPEEAPAICAADNSSGILIAHENCNQFYACDHGEPVVRTCPGGLLYNPYTEQCDWPENVDCGDRVIPDPEASDSESSDIQPPGDDVVVPTSPPGTCNCNPGEAPAICAADNSSGILIAHENCNQFYTCDHGKPVVRTCHGDLLYNPYTEQCDWPENVDCGDRVIPDVSVTTPGVTNPTITTPATTAPTSTTPAVTTPVVTTPAVTTPVVTTPAVTVPSTTTPTVTTPTVTTPIVTTPAVSVPAVTTPAVTTPAVTTPVVTTPTVTTPTVTAPAVTTPESDDDSPEIRPPGDDISPQPPIDDSNETEDCSNSGENGTCNCDPDQAPSICAVDNSDGVLIAHENCNQFYQCDNGVPTPFKCPSNTLYNPVSEVCDWPFNVDCGDRIIPDPEDNESENKEEESEEEEIVGPCNCNPEEAPAICAVDNSAGVQIAHENCNQFYVCDHGSPVTFTCNGLLLYNPYTQHCDWPENVECGNRVIPDPVSDESDSDSNDDDNNIIVNDDPSQAPTICAGYGSDGVLVAHENCDKYYICSAGVPVSRPCSDGLLYNPNNGQCDWPSNVICGNRITPDQCACNYRNAPALCAKPGSDGKLVAHENCNQFYTCAHSVPVAQSCPASLLYNTDTELCDWPQNVKCENRILSRASLNKHWPSLRTLRE